MRGPPSAAANGSSADASSAARCEAWSKLSGPGRRAGRPGDDAGQPREQRRVVGHPVVRGVREDEVVRLGRRERPRCRRSRTEARPPRAAPPSPASRRRNRCRASPRPRVRRCSSARQLARSRSRGRPRGRRNRRDEVEEVEERPRRARPRSARSVSGSQVSAAIGGELYRLAPGAMDVDQKSPGPTFRGMASRSRGPCCWRPPSFECSRGGIALIDSSRRQRQLVRRDGEVHLQPKRSSSWRCSCAQADSVVGRPKSTSTSGPAPSFPTER